MQVGDKVKVIQPDSEFLGRTGIVTRFDEGTETISEGPLNDSFMVFFPCGSERLFFTDEIIQATDIKEVVRKHRRSFEEQLRKYLLKLEQNGEHNTNRLVLNHLEMELHKQMVEHSK